MSTGEQMLDEAETIRRELVQQVNTEPGSRAALEAQHGQVWDTNQLAEHFEVVGFLAPIVVVRRRCDGIKGSLMFQHDPRFCFGFSEDK